MRAYIPTQCEDRREINLQHGLPVLVWKLVRGMPLLYPAAVEQDVDSVSVIENLGHERGDGGVGGEVGSVDCGFAAEGFDGGFGGLVGSVALGWCQMLRFRRGVYGCSGGT